MFDAAMPKVAAELARVGRRIFPRRLWFGLGGVAVAVAFVEPREYHWGVTLGSVMLVAAGLGIRAWAAACAGEHTREAAISAPRLVTDGPYAWVRNPIYLGTMVLSLGMLGMIGDVRLVPLGMVILLALYATLIPAEERFLREKFGEEYVRYQCGVRRLWPNFRKWSGAREVGRDWKNARGEAGIGGILIFIYAVLRSAPYWRGEIWEWVVG